jgi:HAD superfamily hydrolase (TIGR01509 family)
MRAVVFDMDGLMFNSEDVYTAAGTELLRRRGHEFTAELKDAMMGLPARQSFEVMIRYCDLKETWQELAAESNRLFVSFLPERLAMMPGLLDLLAALEQAGIPKAIATSSRNELVDPCLGPFDLRRRFQFVLTAEDVVYGKPNPEIYLTAAQRFGTPPAEMMVLEDSQVGCQAAISAGTFAVAVRGDHSRHQEFTGASLVVDSLSDERIYAALGISRDKSY